ncbi:alkylated DNA repair protein alkB like 8 [Apostasia shenzhenica]|uniref:Alkylated DNA repair protein alkB like 8 n=1 Tax=Apostasia shenzhenica TaxID=1088818 RepID=A0A2I0B3J1_9ASPA|nr:alkylated DNA repair protein alkB like 8 [Apostasia shenzhenica]
MDLTTSRFSHPKSSDNLATSNLYVANCGPAVGISFNDIKAIFGTFGEVTGIHPADESGTRVIVCFSEVSDAQAAYGSLNGRSCSGLGGRILHLRYSVPQQPQKVRSNGSLPISLLSSELAIPGIYLVHNIVTLEEEQMLLAAVDDRPWKSLSKRRVQHYGYEFLYETRNIDSKQFLGELPSFLSPMLEKIFSFHGICGKNGYDVDQLTVNEYPLGIGLSPHIDTHSAFDDYIFSVSLAGSCLMEFRKYHHGSWGLNLVDKQGPHESLNFIRKAIFLPPRSMLLLSGEGRYAWHHYIPHHKVDVVRGEMIRRSSRRISFTFRKVRTGPCRCEYPQYCDSQMDA